MLGSDNSEHFIPRDSDADEYGHIICGIIDAGDVQAEVSAVDENIVLYMDKNGNVRWVARTDNRVDLMGAGEPRCKMDQNNIYVLMTSALGTT